MTVLDHDVRTGVPAAHGRAGLGATASTHPSATTVRWFRAPLPLASLRRPPRAEPLVRAPIAVRHGRR